MIRETIAAPNQPKPKTQPSEGHSPSRETKVNKKASQSPSITEHISDWEAAIREHRDSDERDFFP